MFLFFVEINRWNYIGIRWTKQKPNHLDRHMCPCVLLIERNAIILVQEENEIEVEFFGKYLWFICICSWDNTSNPNVIVWTVHLPWACAKSGRKQTQCVQTAYIGYAMQTTFGWCTGQILISHHHPAKKKKKNTTIDRWIDSDQYLNHVCKHKWRRNNEWVKNLNNNNRMELERANCPIISIEFISKSWENKRFAVSCQRFTCQIVVHCHHYFAVNLNKQL